MELLIWMWVFDNKLLCGLMRHNYLTFVYIWLLPVIIAVSALVLSYLSQFFDGRDMRTCFVEDQVAADGRFVQKLILIQEGLIVCILLSGILTIIQSDRLYRARPEKPSGAITGRDFNSTIDYDFWLKQERIETYSSISFLLLGICNFCFSFVFALGFQRYELSKH